MDDLSQATCLPHRLMSLPIGQPLPPIRLLIEPHTRHELIAQAAYFRALHRGFEPGHGLEDWQAAELEIDTALQASAPGRCD